MNINKVKKYFNNRLKVDGSIQNKKIIREILEKISTLRPIAEFNNNTTYRCQKCGNEVVKSGVVVIGSLLCNKCNNIGRWITNG